jgi:polyisoprenoid-binding protein YceI
LPSKPLRRLFVLVFGTLLTAQAPVARTIDVSRSTAKFTIGHLWVEHVTGSVPILKGQVILGSDGLIPTRVSAVVDATKIDTNEPDRDRDLRSNDFFETDKYPMWTFTSTRIGPESSTAFEMDGDLTIHGVTQPEHFSVSVTGTPARPAYHALTKIDRRVFGMAVTRLDSTIGDTADVTLDIVLK